MQSFLPCNIATAQCRWAGLTGSQWPSAGPPWRKPAGLPPHSRPQTQAGPMPAMQPRSPGGSCASGRQGSHDQAGAGLHTQITDGLCMLPCRECVRASQQVAAWRQSPACILIGSRLLDMPAAKHLPDLGMVAGIVPAAWHTVAEMRVPTPGHAVAGGQAPTALRLVEQPGQPQGLRSVQRSQQVEL